jgi:hypothetical protein
MAIPAFTAEASLYRTTRSYRIRSQHAKSGAVVAAQIYGAGSIDFCESGDHLEGCACSCGCVAGPHTCSCLDCTHSSVSAEPHILKA